MKKTHFNKKSVLDIGCGTGKYLKYLQANGFNTSGIDSSRTAVDMTLKLLANDSDIVCTSMYDFSIEKDAYDLVISISTLHHGTKTQVSKLIKRIYKNLSLEGKVFITVPDIETAIKKGYIEDHVDLGNGTYAPKVGLEKGLEHSMYTKQEVEELFSKFSITSIELDEIGRWFIQAEKV